MVYLGLVDDDEYDDYQEPVPVGAGARMSESAGSAGMAASAPGPALRPLRDEGTLMTRPSVVRTMPATPPKVQIVEPRGFNDAQEVGDRLKDNVPVILNLQGIDRDLQRRLIDFSSGLAYALNATMARVADQVFLLTPSNVEVTDEEKERLSARGLFSHARERG
jgi:cell division inhibitor SepF